MMKNIDSDMQGVLDYYMKMNPPPLESLDYMNARNAPTLKNAVESMASDSATVRTMNVAMPVLPEPVEKVDHILIPTRGGQAIARVFYPSDDGDLPVLVYFHGGGWVIANLDVYEPSCRALSNAAEAIVVSVAYRQAPEFPYPAAFDDACDATQWVMQNAARLGGDPDRVGVAGESAGGNLAATVCLKAKEDGGIMPKAQVLIYPVTDTSMSQPSYAENQDTRPLNAAMMGWFWNYYLGKDASKSDKFVAPLMADDLSGLPPAIVVTAENDPLRDEGEQYAAKLVEAGVSVKSRRFDGVTHEFFGLAGAVGKAKDAVKFATEGLTTVFEKTRTRSQAT